jgi:mono/diheme cytochrome c family protein
LWWALPTVLLALTLGWAAVGANRPALGDAPAAPKPEPISAEAREFFETRVRPVLADQCYACHGKDARMGGLRVDSRAALLKGGDSGPSLVPGDPDKSLLIETIRHTGKIKMPQGGKLKDDEIAALVQWVQMGAPWPGAQATLPEQTGEYQIPEKLRTFWSFQPVKNPRCPRSRTRFGPPARRLTSCAGEVRSKRHGAVQGGRPAHADSPRHV